MTEIERMAEMVARAFNKNRNPEGVIKLEAGTVKSAESDYSKAIVSLADGVELSVLNKSKDKLEEGDSVWLLYTKNLADAVILYKGGLSEIGSGVGEDLGNGNERFNDYENNVVDFNEGDEGEYNTLKGSNNAIVGKADNNEVSGTGNRIAAGNNNVVSGKDNIVTASGADNNEVSGRENFVVRGENKVSGRNNAAGCIPQVPMYYLRTTYNNGWKGNPPEKAGTMPQFVDGGDDEFNGRCEVNGNNNVAAYGSKVLGYNSIAHFYSVCLGGGNNMAAMNSLAFGSGCKAYGNSVAIGEGCSAGTKYTGGPDPSRVPPSTSIGSMEEAGNGGCCFAFGRSITLIGNESIAVGYDIDASGRFDHGIIVGLGLKATNQSECAIFGRYNQYESLGIAGIPLLIVGNGVHNTGSITRSNALVLDDNGNLYISGAYNSPGADYAERYKWINGHNVIENEGLFVTIDGTKIRLANEDDDYILGVISTNPAFIGNDGEEGTPIGMFGQLIVVDDGSCEVNGYCRPRNGGIATKTFDRSCYRVIQRVDESHIKIIFR